MSNETTLIESMANVLGVSTAVLEARIEQHVAQQGRRAQRKQQRFVAARARLTDKQRALLDKHERDGATLEKLLVNLHTNNVAALLVKPRVWDARTGKLKKKLIVLYPDGTATVTLERSVSLRESY